MDFPDDADGDALRRVAAGGNDMSRPMTIDFQIAAPDEVSAKVIAEAASNIGYQVQIYGGPDYDGSWTCECSTRTLATYEIVIAIQQELAELSESLGGYPDGWGTFGNCQTS